MTVRTLVPSLELLIDALQVLAAITCVLTVAWTLSLVLRRRPAARHSVWCGTLVTVLAAPAIVLVLRHAGWQLVALPDAIAQLLSASVANTSARETFGALENAETPAQKNDDATPATSPPAGPDASARGNPFGVNDRLILDLSTVQRGASNSSQHRTPAAQFTEMEKWWALVAAIWLVGSVCLLVRLLHGMVQLRRVARGLVRLDSSRFAAQCAQVSRVLGTPVLPPIAASADVGGPLVIGLARPCVVLPVWLIDRLSPRQFTDVLVHECAHVVRHDQWIVPLQRLAAILFWPHPLIHVMNRQLSRAREEVCDNYVLAGSSPPDFAETLLNIAAHLRPARESGSLAMFGRRGALEGRVKFLLDGRRARRTCSSTFHRCATSLLLLTILVSVAVLRTSATSAGDEAATSVEAVVTASPTAVEPGSRAQAKGGEPDAQHSTTSSPTRDSQSTDGDNAGGAVTSIPNVKDAVNAGKKYLVSQQRENGSWKYAGGNGYTSGATSLALLALIHSGMTQNDKPVAGGLAYLRERPVDEPVTTYERSLVISALAAARDGQRDSARIRRLVQRLEETQLTKGVASGAWSYPLPTEILFDHSNSHFAVIALRDAADYGVPMQRETWRRARDHWIQTQGLDGGWNYAGNGQPSTGSMTAAGISILLIAEKMLGDEKNRNEKREVHADPATEKALKRAFAWMDQNFVASRNPGDQRWLLYYLHGISRAGRLSGVRLFGERDWNAEGTRLLLQHQNARHGSWSETEQGADQVVSTSFALLFFANAAAPIDGGKSGATKGEKSRKGQ